MWLIGAVSHTIYAPSFEHITNGCEFQSYNKAPQASNHCRDGCSLGIFRTASIHVALGVRVGVRVRVWGRVRVRDYVLGRFTQNPCVVLEPHAVHTKYNFFDTVAYLFLYMACIGGS